jgi:hypothetical protein
MKIPTLPIGSLIVTCFLASQAYAELQPIVGVWEIGGGAANASEVIIFLENGIYLYAGDTDEGSSPNEFDGMERGTYSWNEANQSFSATASVDTNGSPGLNGFQGSVSIIGDVLTITDPGEGSIPLNRVWSATFPIVGGWLESGAGPNSYSALVFMSNGVYFFITDTNPAVYPGELDGMERGTYSVNPTTGILYATPTADTNGTANVASGVTTLRVAGDLMTVTDDEEGRVILNRIVHTPGTAEISKPGNQIVIEFSGTLQTSSDLGVWEDVNPQPASPWTFNAVAPKAFFLSRGK